MMNQTLDKDKQAVKDLQILYRSYGYQPYKMSRFEEYDLYVQNKDFLLSDQIITFSDRNGRLMALKPDVTLSIIKNSQSVPLQAQKLYYDENVYRVDKNSQNLREIMQMGLECVGDLTDLETEEVTLLALKSLAVLDDAFILDISHMGLIQAILEESGLTSEQIKDAGVYLHQKNAHEMKKLCVGIDAQSSELLLALVELWGTPNQVLPALYSRLQTERQREMFAQLEHLCRVLTGQGYQNAIRIDFSAGSNMKYYSGVVFTGFLPGLPKPILSGGQYDKLLQKMGRAGSAIGFAIDLNLLQQRNQPDNGYDVDMVLLYQDSDDPYDVLNTAQGLRASGSVSVVRERRPEITCRYLMKYVNGEAVLIEKYD